MEKSKKVRMPAGIRNKLTAAVAMLLVSSIMMVSSTYAWFTLSTAPEVTGITTSVGANGNLEIALLNNTTGANMASIASGVGNSSAVASVTEANITWGNLVDLSDASYGLTGIALLPAALNATYTTTGDGAEQIKTLTGVSVTNPLLTAVYGADGRVATTDGQTMTAVADTNGAFAVSDTPTYGVRAIGTTSSMSVREIALRNAKSTVSAAQNSAKAASKSAINNNLPVLLKFATGATVTAYTTEEIASFRAIANAVVADLATLENGYKNAALAKIASAAADDTEYANAKAILDGMTFSALAGVAGDYGLNAGAMNSLISAQAAAAEAKATLDAANTETSVDTIKAAVQKLVANVDASDASNVYIAGGAIGELGNQLGTYDLASALGSTVYAGTKDSTEATYVAVASTVSTLGVTGGASTTSNITDTYGYIIDFAFRTNASGSNLQLQTSAVNRVYTDQTSADLATQGSGSTVTYAFTSGMTETQVNALLGAIRLVFLNTADGTVYATAGLTDIVVGDTEATANVKLTGQTGNTAVIVALAQNTPTAVSVLVYLDGNEVDNADVPNAASSGMLNLNLQFSSDAELVPMQNTALQTMTAYTVSFNANGGTGYMSSVRASGTYTVPTTTTFTRTGYTFKGWSTAANGEVVASVELSENTTLYAIWEAVEENGSGNGDQQNPVTTYTVTYTDGVEGEEVFADQVTSNLSNGDNTPVFSGENPTREGYDFAGWTPEVATTVTADVIYTAVWQVAE